MLVLTRKCHESVVVGDHGDLARRLRVVVLRINGGKVTLGFEVSKDLEVHRSELWDRIYFERRFSRGPPESAEEKEAPIDAFTVAATEAPMTGEKT
ncbi:MAG TPA: carbon storage regulator [Planctomycetia bacterium]|nr:carbon storage regulator [Planctomycetia bacterium]